MEQHGAAPTTPSPVTAPEPPQPNSVAVPERAPLESARPAATEPLQGKVLSRNQQKKLAKQQAKQSVQFQEFYAGMLPHPEHLERFEALAPGTTDRLISMAEKQGEHRQAMERKFLNFNGFSQAAGVVFAGLICLLSVGGGIYLLATGHSILQFAACLTPLAPIVWAFRRARNQQRAEVARKR
jgi:uncharacterized membrane protein